MSYSALANDEETATSPTPQPAQGGVFPPGYYEDLEAGSAFQNYVHLSTKDHLIKTLNIDTDLAPVFGRFADEEEQKEAKNVLLQAKFINVAIRLQGSAKAKIEVKGGSLHRRVLQITRSPQGTPTQFAVELFQQGRNCTVVVPEAFSGTLAGYIEMSPMLARRSTCLVQDERDLNKTRYTIAPMAPASGAKPSDAPLAVDSEAVSSSISNTREKGKPNNFAGNCYVCLPEEYMLDEEEAVLQEGQMEIRISNSAWYMRFAHAWARLFRYATTGDKVVTCFFAAAFGGIFLFVCLLIYLANFTDLLD